jgi:glycine cleavage system H protein
MTHTYFTQDHEFVRVDNDTATIGITDYAQGQLGDVVFVELPTVGADLARGDEAAVVESVKAASEIYSPVSGKVLTINDDLNGDPSLVNADSVGKGWFFTMQINDKAELEVLMDEAAYAEFIA